MKAFILILFCITGGVGCADQGRVKYGADGQIVEEVSRQKCSRTAPNYPSDVKNLVNGSFSTIENMDNLEAMKKLEDSIIKLRYQLMRREILDFVLFRICEISVNRGLTSQQTKSLIEQIITLAN